ncbi:hypothetical protein ACT9TU_22705 [Raoultella planticola]|uniref:hypothetical protein n=1 Tax=Raoultella planticola TaxID=575 RepID=UPI0040691CA6
MAELPTPTQKTVPSDDIRDHVYAGGMLDKVVTSTDLTYTDRLGGVHYTVDGIKAEGDSVVEETRQNLIPLSRQYMTLADAQADIANIPEGSTTYVRSADGSSLADEYINNGGTLEATGRQMPSKQTISDALFPVLSLLTANITDTKTLINILDADRNIRGDIGEDEESGTLQIRTDDWLLNGRKLENGEFKIDVGSEGHLFRLIDADGNILYAVTTDGEVYGCLVSGGGDSGGSNVVAELQALASALATGESAPMTLYCSVADKKLNIVIVYGQSNAVGADTAYALSTTQMFGNLMLGNSPRGSNFSSGSTVYDYGAVGGNNLVPLVEVIQATTWGETVVSGIVNTAKYLHNRKMLLANDTDRLFAGGSAGVSGATIAKLSPAANQSWGRFTSMLTGFKSAADAAGYTVGSCGIVYIGNEADNAKTYEYYYGALEALKAAMVDAVKSTFGQNTDTHLVLTQYGGQFAYDATHQASAIALVDFCDNNPDVSFAGCQHQYPGPGAHLASNSYRWLGANIAKALHQALNGTKQPTFRIIKAQHSGNKIYVAAKVPVPPITFKTAYDKWAPVDYTDRGFTVTDDTGTLVGSELSVDVIAPCVIQITCSRQLAGEVRVTLGDLANHAGVHNIADSDPSVSMFSWEYHEGTTQPAAENIAGLLNKPYPLFNWCARDSVISEKI